MPLGYVVSPFVGGAIVMKSNFGAIFYASAGVGFIAFSGCFTLPADNKKLQGAFDYDDESLFTLPFRLRLQ